MQARGKLELLLMKFTYLLRQKDKMVRFLRNVLPE